MRPENMIIVNKYAVVYIFTKVVGYIGITYQIIKSIFLINFIKNMLIQQYYIRFYAEVYSPRSLKVIWDVDLI